MFALVRLIPLREAPWPGGSVAGPPWGRPLVMSWRDYVEGVSWRVTVSVHQWRSTVLT